MGKAGQGAGGSLAVYLYLKGRVIFGAGLAQHGVSGQGFAVHLGDEIGVAGAVLLPHFADFNAIGSHVTTVMGTGWAVNNEERRAFVMRRRGLSRWYGGSAPHFQNSTQPPDERGRRPA